ncbi:MAG: adenosylcobinamide amidohydrolase [Deltaproteobacteria bacterium]|jgi:adenosylcobinamide amidohydrolase|nr:adenosylcobinamide amidohydrolase [Deltaproteobacteria bacterium]
MLLATPYEGLEIHRVEKLVYGRFSLPHAVLSTCRSQGGYREDLAYLGNHQSCEPAAHHHKSSLAINDPLAYQAEILNAHGLAPEKTALLGTAANMRLLTIKTESFAELTLTAAVTGGVETNAARAGDPAVGHEGPDGYYSLDSLVAAKDPNAGTINILVFVSRPMTKGAMVRGVSLITEAKTCALQELGVNSRYSSNLASGTGTDQIGLAARLLSGVKPLAGGGHHIKMGELMGRVVKEAVKEVLVRQNGLTPDRMCSVKIHLERFNRRPDGRYRLSSLELVNLISQFLSPELAELLANNYLAFFHDPWVVAATAALAHLKDKFVYGVLPRLIWPEVMGAFAGQLAAAVSGRLDLAQEYARDLGPNPVEALDDQAFLGLAARALALGLRDKWTS